MLIRLFLKSLCCFIVCCVSLQAAARTVNGIECVSPPPEQCDRETGCTVGDASATGNVTDPVTGRTYFLDFPCDLEPGERVNFILSIHGAGSIGNWHRHYFPALDYLDEFNLVVATPTSLRDGPVPLWTERDDEHLIAIVNQVTDAFGQENIRSFWLAGHSQGGMTSNRLVCSPFFRNKVDGWLSLSGGRIGSVEIPDDFFGDNPPPQALTNGMESSGTGFGQAAVPDCDFSFIFTSGENEIVELPDTSPWAEKYACSERESLDAIVDVEKGYVSARDPDRGPSWGGEAKAGTAIPYTYPDCSDDRLVADVIRLDKGHTEGLEPEVTFTLLQIMMAAPAGKLSGNE